MEKFTMENLSYLLGLIQTLVSNTKATIEAGYNALVGALGTDKEGNAHTVKSYVDSAIESVNGDNSALADRVTANETAIDAINNEATGILAKAKAYFAEQWAALTAADGGVINKLNEIVAWFTGLETTDPGAVALLTDVAANKTAVTTTLPNAITKAQEDAEGYADGVVGDLENGQVKTNKEAIEAINDEATGILALAKADATTKSGTAEQNAKDYTDQQIEAIEAYTDADIQAVWDEVFNPKAGE